MADVFISYSRKDKAFVQRLDEALKKRDRAAWVDWEGIRPTEEFMQAIYSAIEGADAFVFVLSPDSISSVICRKELAHAVAQNKRMIPVVAHDVNAAEVPEALAKLNWIFGRDSDDFDAATAKLVTALDTDLDWVRGHTRLLTRAVEWDAKGHNNSFVLRGDDLRAAERWLTVAGADKERQPTALQTAYIITSRKAAARRQRITLGAVSFGLVVAIVLGLLAWQQWTNALKTLSRSYYQEACGLIDEDRAPEALAYLAHALEVDPSNRPAAIRLLTLLIQRNWILPVTEPLPHDEPVVAVSFSSDESKLLTESGGIGVYGSAQVWDVSTGRPLTPPLHSGVRFTRGELSPSGQSLVTWNTNYYTTESIVSVWRTSDGAKIGEVAGGESARFIGDGAHLAVSDSDAFGASDISAQEGLRIIRGYGPVREPAGPEISAHLHNPRLYQVSPESLTLTPRDPSGLGPESEELIRQALTQDNAIKSPDLSAGKNRVLVATKLAVGAETAAEINVFQTGASEPLWTKKVFEGFQAAYLDSAGRDVISLRQENEQVICSRDRLQSFQTKSFQVKTPVLCAIFEPNSNTLLLSVRTGGLRLWDMADALPLGEALKADGDLVNAAIAPTQHLLATGSRNHTARIWDARPSASLASPLFRSGLGPLAPPRLETADLRFVDGENLNPNGITQIDGKILWEFTREPGFKHRYISFSADASLLLAVSNAAQEPLFTNCLTVYEARTGKVVNGPYLVSEQIAESEWAGISPGNQILALVSGQTVYLWDLTNKGNSSFFREFHVGAKALEVSFSPEGGELFVRTEPGQVAHWDIESGHRLSDFQPVSGDAGDSYDLAWNRLQGLKSAPHWIIELACAVCGFELRENHLVPTATRVPTLRRLSQQLDKARSDDLYTVAGKWFFADRAQRPISPKHTVRVSDFIGKKLAENDEAAVRQAEIAASFDSAVLVKARARRAAIENSSPTETPAYK